ncbi:MAG: hypothetical protein INR65_09460, partial [Gluconacetobacter diazotrophicus]|nr:hypothetical protein [Gluconacetobacter diazotrophicus]
MRARLRFGLAEPASAAAWASSPACGAANPSAGGNATADRSATGESSCSACSAGVTAPRRVEERAARGLAAERDGAGREGSDAARRGAATAAERVVRADLVPVLVAALVAGLAVADRDAERLDVVDFGVRAVAGLADFAVERDAVRDVAARDVAVRDVVARDGALARTVLPPRVAVREAAGLRVAAAVRVAGLRAVAVARFAAGRVAV